ncbi:MAG: acyl-CoA dehydrogenase, partial [Gammaproteobacteria bacterium]|nr:acyl-CoA dehydrogenase [Gammaproteobacteria bacterium]
MTDGTDATSPYYTEEHEAFRDVVRRWVTAEIEPYATQWDGAEEFPRELYRKAADIGLLQLGYPEAYGGIEVDLFFHIIALQEVARAGSGGILAGLFSHTISAPPILIGGSEELRERVLPGIIAGEKICALGVTEPGAGSDVAALRTSARRDGDDFVLNGSKTFITSGMRADYVTVAARTGEAGRNGISMLLVETDSPGFDRTKLDKTGWWASDMATLYFD